MENQFLEIKMAKTINGDLPKSFTKDFSVNPLEFNTNIEICYFCKEIIENLNSKNKFY